jgi:hypothetical protein
MHKPIVLMQITSVIIKREIGLSRGYQFQVAEERIAISKLLCNAGKK